MLNKIKGLIKEEQGQGMTEYGLVLGVIAVGAVGVLSLFGKEITTFLTNTINNITDGFNNTAS
ncbi:Flp family type IVb pilin [Oceanobacillus halophilus]|uniref:Flp family type IVb pilin n=1 Tax=Oceanobacillus halophilus TaxID=930130 RepID=A0A495A1E1_9BACI|nr:Flp family type IVb pilin [Oceanobacillus halophilus]RKQ33261.1 Flp family type IVb pilin [Oceanobacillus halophilus]